MKRRTALPVPRAPVPSPSSSTMSSCTAGVAVAVIATTGAPGSCGSRSPSIRYSGRKSWPQWLMQWASSMATSAGVFLASSSGKPGTARRSGAKNRKSRSPRR